MKLNLASHINLRVLVQINFGGFTRHQFMSYSSSHAIPRKGQKKLMTKSSTWHPILSFFLFFVPPIKFQQTIVSYGHMNMTTLSLNFKHQKRVKR